MDKPEDHGGGDVNNPFCQYCTDAQGNLLPKDQVRAKMIQFYIQKQNKTQAEAEKLTDQLMEMMPAWKGKAEEAPSSAIPAKPAVTPEPMVSPPEPAPVKSEPEPTATAGPSVTSEPTITPTPAEPAAEPVTGEGKPSILSKEEDLSGESAEPAESTKTGAGGDFEPKKSAPPAEETEETGSPTDETGSSTGGGI